MYRLIEKYAGIIVKRIPPDYVSKYDWLLENADKVMTSEYQMKYRDFWAMNAALPSDEFCSVYFSTLQSALNEAKDPPSLKDIVKILYPATERKGKNPKKPFPPFSFATKLKHMTNTALPVYDKWVVGFYFLRVPTLTKTGGIERRIVDYIKIHDFLVEEYARVLGEGLLSSAIQKFESELKPRHFSKEKIIDSLIWAFAGNNLLQTKAVIYE
jgi:hypothetical protein